ncbi:unnamed protein product [Meganyctiphanes norvegica]|uniref:G-protein coupled receptors family 1 profile domain-containing protein n=1 Tax=Meganyctiphanes norvegica TaxID=48144 RepID=A0AAV2RIB6_MEGNR
MGKAGEPVAAPYFGRGFSNPLETSYGYPEGITLVDFASPHMKPYIDPHWAEYPPVNPMWHYVLGIIYVILLIFAITGNGLVVYLFSVHRPIRTPSNFLVVNLALSDFVMLLTNCPVFIFNCFNGGHWSFSIMNCHIYAALGAVTGFCSIWTLTCISLDRYNVICTGFSGPRLTKGKAALMSIFCWCMSTGIAAAPFFGWGGYGPEGILTSCSFDYLSQDSETRSYNLFLFLFDYCVPLLIIIWSYVFIVRAIWAHEATMRAQAAKMNVKSLRTSESNEQKTEIRIAKTAIFNIALWIICWTPYAAITMQGCFGFFSHLSPLATTLPALLAKSASCYNPFVYAIGHPRFRQAMTVHMPWFCVKEEAKDSAGEDNTSNATSVQDVPPPQEERTSQHKSPEGCIPAQRT